MAQVHPKVAAGGVAGAVVVVVVFAVAQFGITVPADVAAAVTTIVSFAAGFFKSA